MALGAHKKKNYKESEKLWYKSAKADPSWSKTYFNLACTTALQGKKKAAVEYLRIALQLNVKLLKSAQKDSDLKSLKGDKEYKELINGYKDLIGYWVNLLDGASELVIGAAVRFEYSVRIEPQQKSGVSCVQLYNVRHHPRVLQPPHQNLVHIL